MSADNGIYILKTLDGYRVILAQNIENLYWWETWSCCGNPVPAVKDGENYCIHCGNTLPAHEKRDEINPLELAEYFGRCNVLKTEKEAWEEAQSLYEAIMEDDYCPILEFGVQFIKGYEDKEFPTHLVGLHDLEDVWDDDWDDLLDGVE